MAGYSFKKEASVYVVLGTTGNTSRYNVDVSDISFSQTIAEDSYSSRTVTGSEYFEQSKIYKANPANFTFSFYLLASTTHFDALLDTIVNINTFDLYIQTKADTFKVSSCIATNMSFSARKQVLLQLEVSGEGSKLERVGDGSYAILADNTFDIVSKTYITTSSQQIDKGPTQGSRVSIFQDIVSYSVELQNDIEWVPYTSVQNTLAGSVSYPSSFTVSKRSLAGNIQKYVSPDNTSLIQSHDEDFSLLIRVGQNIGGQVYGLEFDMGHCSYTDRVSVGDVFIQSLDWRYTDNSVPLSNVISYTTI